MVAPQHLETLNSLPKASSAWSPSTKPVEYVRFNGDCGVLQHVLVEGGSSKEIFHDAQQVVSSKKGLYLYTENCSHK